MKKKKEGAVKVEGHIFLEKHGIHTIVIPRSDVKKLRVKFDGWMSVEEYEVTIKLLMDDFIVTEQVETALDVLTPDGRSEEEIKEAIIQVQDWFTRNNDPGEMFRVDVICQKLDGLKGERFQPMADEGKSTGHPCNP